MKARLFPIAAAALLMSAGTMAQPRDWAQFGRYAESNKTVQAKPLAVFMGDSITDNWDNCDEAFFTDNNYVCRGISGQTTSEMLVRFRQDVINLHPKYVVILAGTNDLALNNGAIESENILGNLISMCELARLHKIKPILCSVIPSGGFGWRPEVGNPAGKIVELNKMIRDYAKSARIEYVDYHAALRDENDELPANYAPDKVHPTPEAYKIMESVIVKYLK